MLGAEASKSCSCLLYIIDNQSAKIYHHRKSSAPPTAHISLGSYMHMYHGNSFCAKDYENQSSLCNKHNRRLVLKAFYMKITYVEKISALSSAIVGI